MAKEIIATLKSGKNTLGLFYGHPGVFVSPTYEAICLAKEMNFNAYMLPAISAEDCLYADLLIDPGASGCQSYEATDFLVYNRSVDLTVPLILWQVGVLGHMDYQKKFDDSKLVFLRERLARLYGSGHKVTSYIAATFNHLEPEINSFPLCELLEVEVTPLTTLYIPPLSKPTPDKLSLKRLGLESLFGQSC
jgi:hypothetical protein